MAQTDRNAGLVANAAVKNPCVAGTTANITLSGEQSLDGVALVTGDRALVKDQDDATENGLYEVDTGAWTRTKDCNGAFDLVTGSLVYVRTGTASSGWFYMDTADTIDIGTDSLTWARASTALATVSAFMQTLIDDASAVIGRQTLLLDKVGSDISSAATIDLDASTGDYITVNGTVTITTVTLAAGIEKTVRFSGILTLTHGASLIGPGAASILTAADDVVIFRGEAGGVVRVIHHKRALETETVTGVATLNAEIRVSNLDSNAGAVTATLGGGRVAGDFKLITMTEATTLSTLSVTSHAQSVGGQIFAFDSVNDSVLLQWLGEVWMTVRTFGATFPTEGALDSRGAATLTMISSSTTAVAVNISGSATMVMVGTTA